MAHDATDARLPPLAGICSYARAAEPGIAVDATVVRLRRLAYVLRRLADIAAAHIARTPEWEMKCALGLHLWLDTEHATLLRDRIAELRQPPLHLDEAPDARLEAVMEEALRAQDTPELLEAVFAVLRPALLAAVRVHLDELNPLFDHPTARILRIIECEQAEAIEWGEAARRAWTPNDRTSRPPESFGEHVRGYLAAAGGVLGTTEPGATASLAEPRWDGSAYEIDARPRRDDRFADPFNATARIDEIYADEAAPPRERSLALACKRLREMDVPEWMGPILFAARAAPWERRRDLARQLWDETRHAMMGETVIEAAGVPFHAYPIDMAASVSLNTEFTPLEAHLVLWHIEQGLMRSGTGKRFEWEVARLDDDPLIANVQDFDWADEVLHAQIGRRCLPEQIDGQSRAAVAAAIDERWTDVLARYAEASSGRAWWDEFVARAGASGAGPPAPPGNGAG
jgi:hypothetical protein